MFKYHEGDTFTIEIGAIFCDAEGNTLYQIKGFKSLVFDEYGLNTLRRLEKAKESPYKPGDEVLAEDGKVKFVVTHVGNDICGIDDDGRAYAYFPEEICRKTGRRFNVHCTPAEERE